MPQIGKPRFFGFHLYWGGAQLIEFGLLLENWTTLVLCLGLVFVSWCFIFFGVSLLCRPPSLCVIESIYFMCGVLWWSILKTCMDSCCDTKWVAKISYHGPIIKTLHKINPNQKNRNVQVRIRKTSIKIFVT